MGQVVEIVRNSGSSVTFHVLNADSYKLAKEMDVNLSDTNISIRPVAVYNHVPKAKLCYLIKSGPTFGFSLKSVKGKMLKVGYYSTLTYWWTLAFTET